MNRTISKLIVFVGDNNTGKSSILSKYCKNKYDSEYMETIGKYSN